MPNKVIAMEKALELFRLKYEFHLSNRKIAIACHISHSTVRDHLRRFQQASLPWPLPSDMTEQQLGERLFPPKEQRVKPARPLPDWASLDYQLARKHVTLQLLWEEYRRDHPEGYERSRFCELYRSWARQKEFRMRLPHKAGEKLYVDYAGDKIPIVDPITGEILFEASVFVSALGVSQLIYAEAHENQSQIHWIGGHVRGLEFYGGAPIIAVPDNLKTGVKSPCYYDPEINPVYCECLRHYGMVALPARVRKPRDKAKVENAVLQVERWIIARLRNQCFHSLASLNNAIRELLQELNERPMAVQGKSRRQVFEEIDRPALRPLPERPYEYAERKKATVHIDGHVQVDRCFYSVPWGLLHEEVWVRISENTVEIRHASQREPVAIHPRLRCPGQCSTRKEHLPKTQQEYQEWPPERFLSWAESIGPATRAAVEKILDSREHPEQSYRSCLGILQLAKKYGRAALENACRKSAVQGLDPRYRTLKPLAAKFTPPPEDVSPGEAAAALAPHDNLRGKEYFQ
jgi:transposase